MSESLNIFVSYSHHDADWLKKLQSHLRPLVRGGQINLWDDTHISAGVPWKDDIEQALATANVAILLISHQFLASDFIVDKELHPLLKAAEDGGLTIMPVIIGSSLFEEMESLSAFQAVNDPQQPINSLPEWEQEEQFVKIAREILRRVQLPSESSPSDLVFHKEVMDCDGYIQFLDDATGRQQNHLRFRVSVAMGIIVLIVLLIALCHLLSADQIPEENKWPITIILLLFSMLVGVPLNGCFK